jgi:hypothetical protein
MIYTEGRIIVKVDTEQKNHFTFSNGTTIRLERDYDNFDRKYTQQVMGVVVSAESIPTDALILFHHNSLHPTYRIYNHSQLSGEEVASGIKLFSIMERDCFFWKRHEEKSWHPTEGFATALRVYQPYVGVIQGVEPKQLKDTLYVTSGEYKGIVVRTVKACDYMIIFRDERGAEERIVRFRPNGIEKEQREPEAIAIMNSLTKKVNKGELYVGLTNTEAAPVKNIQYAK